MLQFFSLISDDLGSVTLTKYIFREKRTMFTKIVLLVEIVAFRLVEIRRVLFPL